MPQRCSSNPCIPQQDLDTVTAWINEGAPNN
jgi:hypothetical protein